MVKDDQQIDRIQETKEASGIDAAISQASALAFQAYRWLKDLEQEIERTMDD